MFDHGKKINTDSPPRSSEWWAADQWGSTEIPYTPLQHADDELNG